MTKEIIIVMGPQGSGKSTQGKLLSEFLNCGYISTGQLVRKISETENDQSTKLKEYWLNGKLIPDDLINEILFDYIKKHESDRLVLDGYPRDEAQLKHLMEFLEINKSLLRNVFYIAVSEEECIKRLMLRRKTENRPDDESEEGIKNRLLSYYKNTDPLLIEFEKMGRLNRIDGERDINAIQDDIRSHFVSVEFSSTNDIPEKS